MNCRSIQKKFSAYQDRELKLREQAEVKSHLLSCRSCHEQYAEFERLWQTLGEMEGIHPDPWFYRQVLGKLQEPHEQGSLSTFRHVLQLLRAPAIASVFILAVGIMAGIYLGNVMVRSDFLPFGQPTTVHSQEETLLDSLKAFDVAPPGTLAHGYLQMVSYKEHESR